MTANRTATHQSSASSPTTNNRGVTTQSLPAVKTEMTLQQGDAIEAFGQFVISIEEALPQEVAGTSDVAKDPPSRVYRWPTDWSAHSMAPEPCSLSR